MRQPDSHGVLMWTKSLFESKELSRQVSETFATVDEASTWLHRPHPMLDGVTPHVAAKNSLGEQRVKDILLSIRLGGNV